MDFLVPVAMIRRVSLSLFILAAICPIMAVAQPSYYFPGTNINYTGGSNSFPLNSTSSNKCQFLYKSTDFNTAPGTRLITTVYVKPSSTRTNQSLTSFTIKMANTTLTTLTSGTWISGLTTVYSPSTLTISTTSGQWEAFTLTTPFVYTGGNLLVEISQANTTAPGISLNHITVTGRNGRMYGSRTSSSSSGASASTALFGFDGGPANCSGTPQVPTITTSAMSSSSPICAGSTKALTAHDPNAPMSGLSYRWQSGTSATGPWTNVSSGSGSTTLNYTTPALSTTTWYRVGVTCSNSNLTTYSAAYMVRVGASQPGTITGNMTSCPGDTAVYSVPAVAGHTYTWSLPTGWSGTSTSNTITVIPSASSGTISVVANGCGAASVARTKAILPGSAPGTPGTMTGRNNICPNVAHTFSVSPVTGAKYYTWTLPNGWTGASNTNSISALPDTTSGNVVVKAVNGCGTSAVSLKAVHVIKGLDSPGTIRTSASNGLYCSGQLYRFSINPVPGATSYQWTLPSGWSGTTIDTAIQAFAGSTGGQVQVTAYVACATSPTSKINTPVSTSVTPAVSIAPGSPTICTGKPTTFTASPTNGGTSPTYQWRKNGTLMTATGATYTDASLVSGDVISVKLISSLGCKTLDTVQSNNINVAAIATVTPGININTTPVITICGGTNVRFSTTTVGGGTAPTYQWYINGTAISGANSDTYSSATLANADTVTVRVTSSAICTSVPSALSNKVGMVVNPAVTPSVNITSGSTAAGQPITFTATDNGGGAAPGYQWMRNGVYIPGETAAVYNAASLAAGDHISLQLLSTDPCATTQTATSNTIIIGSPTSVGGTAAWTSSLGLHPNPNQGRFVVNAVWPSQYINKAVAVSVYNLTGQLVYHRELVADKSVWRHEVQLPDAANGHYILRVSTADGLKANLPLVINR